ncbi:nucleophile aminohydrolase [Kalaharituber pfeilii]|nr:nucleophile aminohydrolase [Kalaharituber pfeilii]
MASTFFREPNVITDFPRPTDWHAAAPVVRHDVNPYTNNGGTILGITGQGFAILAGDTRHTQGYNINSRTEKKVWRLSKDSTLVMAAVGFGADALDLRDTMRRAVEDYKFQHNKDMSVSAAAQLLMTVLYGNRFFPKYAYCILIGLLPDGTPRLYSYDPVGSYSKEGERRHAAGAAASLIVPFLDNQVEFKNQYHPYQYDQEKEVIPLSLDTAMRLVKDAFTGATERHTEVGDGLQIITVSKDGVTEEIYKLKED